MNLYAAVHATEAGAALTTDPHEATHACLTPAQLHRLGSRLGDHVEICVAGARLPATAARPGIVHYYGSAELSFVAAGDHGDAMSPFDGVEVELRDGEIWARSDYLCLGYRGAAGPLRWDAEGWATVGDVGRWDREGLTVLGRPGTITTAGATVSIVEVEAVLSRVATRQIAVYAQPHPAAGELIAVAIERGENLPALRAFARSNLPPTHRPRSWLVVEEIPTTDAGKVDTAVLLESLHA